MTGSLSALAFVPSGSAFSMLLIGANLLADHDHPCTDKLGSYLVIAGTSMAALYAASAITAYIKRFIVRYGEENVTDASWCIVTAMEWFMRYMIGIEIILVIGFAVYSLPLFFQIDSPGCPGDILIDVLFYTSLILGMGFFLIISVIVCEIDNAIEKRRGKDMDLLGGPEYEENLRRLLNPAYNEA